MFRLNGVDFEIDEDESYICFDDDHEVYLDIKTKLKEYNGDMHNPYVNINPIETNIKNKKELIGFKFTVSTIEEADEREDSFYLYEHEPFVEYKLEVKDIKGDKARILLKAIVVEDGYAKPYTTASLEVDCWLKLEC